MSIPFRDSVRVEPLLSDSVVAKTTIPQYSAVKLDGDGFAVLAAAEDEAVGITQYGVSNPDPDNGEAVAITILGFTPVRVNGNSVNIAKYDRLECAASGLFQKQSADGGVSQATAQIASDADGDQILAFVDFVKPPAAALPA